MSMDVRGPKVPQPNALPNAKGPVTQTPTGITGAQALKNAEGMFGKSFEKMGEGTAVILENIAAIGTPLIKDNIQTPKVKQEILEVFQELKSQHLKEKPSGLPVAESFDHPTLTTLTGTLSSEDVESQLMQLLDTPMGNLPPQAQRALRQISDAKFARDMGNLVTSEQLQSTPEYQYFSSPQAQTLMKQAAPTIMALVAHLNGKTNDGGDGNSTRLGIGLPGSNKGTDKTGKGGKDTGAPSKLDPFGKNAGGTKEKSGAKETGAPASAAPTDEAGVVELFDQLTPVVTSAMRMFGENMDISSMIIILMGLLAKDAEDDLKDMMKKMQHNMQIKQAKKEMRNALEDDMNKVKERAQNELDALKREGKVPADLTVNDYLAYCTLSGPDPIMNEETGDWQTFPPTLTPPSPLPADWRTGTDDTTKGCSPGAIYANGIEQLGNPDNKENAAKLGQAIAGSWSTEKWEDAFQSSGKSKEEWSAYLKECGVNPLPAAFRNAQDPYSSEIPKGNGNRMQDQIDKLTDEMDSMGSQSELDQTRMQLYMDRRAKAFETLSNLQKKISESLAAIIKNQT